MSLYFKVQCALKTEVAAREPTSSGRSDPGPERNKGTGTDGTSGVPVPALVTTEGKRRLALWAPSHASLGLNSGSARYWLYAPGPAV